MFISKGVVTTTKGFRLYVIGRVGLALLISALTIAQALITLHLVFTAMQGLSPLSLLPSLIGLAMIIGARAGLIWWQEVNAATVGTRVKEAFRARLFTHLLELGPTQFTGEKTGKLQSMLMEQVDAVEAYLVKYVPQAVVVMLTPPLIALYIATLQPLIAVIILAATAAALFSQPVWYRLVGDRRRVYWARHAALNGQIVNAMQGMATLKAFNAGSAYGKNLSDRAMALFRGTMDQIVVTLMHTGFATLATGIGTAFAVGLAAYYLALAVLTPFETIAILFLSAECFRPIGALAKAFHYGYSGIHALEDIEGFLARAPLPAPTSAAVPKVTTPALRFENVSFSYEGTDKPALRDISFQVGAGQRVAIVGPSGAGKTTLTMLLLRFLDPQSGRILVDDMDIAGFDRATGRSLFGLVPQDTYLFCGTVAENLRLARPAASDAEIEAACRSVNAHEFIAAMPQGYQTVIGERGLKLSGGQRQRIAIARALLKDAPILILDEATASVDTENEAQIREAIERLIAGRTTLIIAHRLSTIANADSIVVLNDGEVAEIGAHHSLLRRSGTYATLYAAERAIA